jgi:tripartite-type tricarboxylate transporter receptor subunit TctC
VGYAAGGATDAVARIVAQKLSDTTGQQFFVENKPGAGGNVGAQLAATSPADGTTFILVAPAHAINATLYSKLPFDPVKDFTPVVHVASVTNLMVVHPSVPANSVAELVALAKAKPGSLSYASAGSGASSHLAAEIFKSKTGVNIVHVPYKGTGQSVVDLLAGQVQLTLDSMPALLPHVKAGKLRALAVGSTKRSAALPDVPTMQEAGVPGFEVTVWLGLLGPANTPPEIVNRLNAEVNKIVAMPDVREKLAGIGAEPIGGTPQQFGALVQTEIAKYAEVIKATGARVD